MSLKRPEDFYYHISYYTFSYKDVDCNKLFDGIVNSLCASYRFYAVVIAIKFFSSLDNILKSYSSQGHVNLHFFLYLHEAIKFARMKWADW